MNIKRRIQYLVKKLERKAALDDANGGKGALRSTAAERRMDRVEREMAQTARIVQELNRGGTSRPSAARRINKSLAITSRNLRRIDKALARMAKTLSKINGRRSQTNGRLSA